MLPEDIDDMEDIILMQEAMELDPEMENDYDNTIPEIPQIEEEDSSVFDSESLQEADTEADEQDEHHKKVKKRKKREHVPPPPVPLPPAGKSILTPPGAR